MQNTVIIRNYIPKDRQRLRQICCDVADRGAPIENLFSDRKIAADLLTSYYTNYEPQSSFVAEVDGVVVGYITGCLDNRRWGLVMFWILIPAIMCKGFKRGVFFNRAFCQMAYGSLLNWRRLFSWRKNEFHSHQGHIHIGIVDGFRHQHIGEQLVNRFCVYARSKGAGQVTASVRDDNVAACRFFQRLGFVVNERYSMLASHVGKLERYQALVYVKNLI